MPENTAFAGLHAVVAEDSQHMRALLRSMLRALGFAHVAVETNGTDALGQITAGSPDVVLLDWNMPGLSGIDVVRAIRNLPEPLRRVPVMMVTAHASPQRLALAKSLGVNDFLCKPISISALENRLQRIVQDPYLVQQPEPTRAARKPKTSPPAPAQKAGSPITTSNKDEGTDLESFYV